VFSGKCVNNATHRATIAFYPHAFKFLFLSLRSLKLLSAKSSKVQVSEMNGRMKGTLKRLEHGGGGGPALSCFACLRSSSVVNTAKYIPFM
jgi:hypothetical protein